MRRPLIVVLLAATAPLAACASVKEAVNGPELSPMDRPSMVASQNKDVASLAASIREPAPQAASANSLWRTGARAFFHDQRAARVGDILTVLININDAAKTQNATTAITNNSNAAGISNLFGLESTLARILPKAFDPSKAIGTNSALSAQGSGSVNRQEQISLTIAAVVTEVLPNGNLMIQGSQEVETNDELRDLTITGIVRPEDISSSNTIQHTQIAEARIYYGGRGDVSAVQKTPAGTALLQRYLPF